MKLTDWNTILTYADAIKAKIERAGVAVRVNEYDSYLNGPQKGIAISLVDNRGKNYTTQYSGTWDTVAEYIQALDRVSSRLIADFC